MFKLDNFFVQKLSVLVKDSLESSHPVSIDVDNPDEINSIFDSISYDKVCLLFQFFSDLKFNK
jgi:aminopeptidase N